jgi:hypothetical protein
VCCAVPMPGMQQCRPQRAGCCLLFCRHVSFLPVLAGDEGPGGAYMMPPRVTLRLLLFKYQIGAVVSDLSAAPCLLACCGGSLTDLLRCGPLHLCHAILRPLCRAAAFLPQRWASVVLQLTKYGIVVAQALSWWPLIVVD